MTPNPDWERGWRGKFYASARRFVPLPWRRAIRRRFAPERLLGIRKPEIELTTFDSDASAARPGRPDILFLPVIAWSYRRQRPQQLAEALARRGRRVFYGALAGPGEPTTAAGVAPGVTLLPVAGIRREDPADRRLRGDALRQALRTFEDARSRYGLREAAMIVQTPFWTPLARELADRFGWKIVYDCLDEHSGFAKNRPGVLSAEEKKITADADLVVATSQVLLERFAKRSHNARLLPNACDEALFGEVPDPPAGDPLVVGYVGAVDDWFDRDLFRELARLRPDWRFEIVGGMEDDRAPVSDRASMENVVFHGERPHRELPGLRARFHVEIIPFRLSPLTHAVDPVKLYEAAAAGRPVVATPMQSLSSLARMGIVRLAATASEFAKQIEEAAAEGPEGSRRRREFARENTWDRRAGDLDRWIHETYPSVSVVVLAGREPDRLKVCLASLERSTDWPRFESVVVVERGESATAERKETGGSVLDDLRDAAAASEGARLVSVARGSSPAAAADAGFEAAGGEFVFLLDAAATPTGGWLSTLVRHIDRDPTLGMVGATVENAAPAPIPGTAAPDDPAAMTGAEGLALAAESLEPVERLSALFGLFHRSVYRTVGPFEKSGSGGLEGYGARVRGAGLGVAVARDAIVRRSEHADEAAPASMGGARDEASRARRPTPLE